VVEELCERTLALVGGRAEAVVTASTGTAALTRFANGRIHQNVSEDTVSVRLTVAVDGRVARTSTTRTDDAGLARLVDGALAAAVLRPPDPEFAGFAPAAPVAAVDHWDGDTAAATPDDRAGIVAEFVAAADGAGDAAGFCSTRGRHRALAATSGQRAATRSTMARVDGIHRVGAGDGFAQATAVAVAAIDGAACGTRAAAKARAAAEPVELPPGRYEVVLEPRAVASVLLFPAYLGFNGKAHADGTSFVRLGETQWDAAVDVWDDATDPRALGDPYDAEGTPKRRVELVRAGVSVGLTHDRRSARLVGAEPTGHSVGSEAFGGYATDLFLGAGERSPDDLVREVERGLLVTDFWYNRILDPKSQVVTGLTRNGLFLIERGRVGAAVQNLRYTQSIVGAFGPGQVRGLGDDAQLVGGEGSVMHVPSVRLAGWSFTGNARG
jgi:predicted Zn-dependent protease